MKIKLIAVLVLLDIFGHFHKVGCESANNDEREITVYDPSEHSITPKEHITSINGQIDLNQFNATVEKSFVIPPEFVPTLIQHTLLVNVFQAKNNQTFGSKLKKFFFHILYFEFPFKKSAGLRKRIFVGSLSVIQHEFWSKTTRRQVNRLPKAIEFANSMQIEYELVIENGKPIMGRQSPLEMELELCKRANPNLAQILLDIKADFEFTVEAEQFFDRLNAHLISTYEKHDDFMALNEISEKVTQIHILVLYTMFYNEFIKTLEKMDTLLLESTYFYESKWLTDARKAFVSHYLEIRPSCFKYNEKILKKSPMIDEFIREDVRKHLAKCDKLMSSFGERDAMLQQLVAVAKQETLDEAPVEIHHMIMF
ncbi:hypothetical protein niasHT_023100 [Heterodera trifolii]|uniref:Uncharacterized protein n=1 Tax=Heterodera trifolii TaxID=157864 RepID=A0ABD2KF66_9BILA